MPPQPFEAVDVGVTIKSAGMTMYAQAKLSRAQSMPGMSIFFVRIIPSPFLNGLRSKFWKERKEPTGDHPVLGWSIRSTIHSFHSLFLILIRNSGEVVIAHAAGE